MITEWQPDNLSNLKLRASIFAQIRKFFAERNILEVETPLLGSSSVTDPFISSFETYYQNETKTQTLKLFLQTSPEYAMKRLLSAGAGDIYQLCKAFRNNESGSRHNSEFTILEWYRLEFDHHQLMDEVNELIMLILNSQVAERISYEKLFRESIGINPHSSSIQDLINIAEKYHIQINDNDSLEDKDTWLNILLTHIIEPQLGKERPIFVYDYPASQAALAQIRNEEFPVGERFELYFKSVELANGYHELSDPIEQHRRFLEDNHIRRQKNLPEIPIDNRLLSALTHGLPKCAGVAVGVDRLLMLVANAARLSEVMSFCLEKA
jgi:lysyl-tRNA synthetase class 2